MFYGPNGIFSWPSDFFLFFFFKLFVTLLRTLSKGENNSNDLTVQIIAVLF